MISCCWEQRIEPAFYFYTHFPTVKLLENCDDGIDPLSLHVGLILPSLPAACILPVLCARAFQNINQYNPSGLYQPGLTME